MAWRVRTPLFYHRIDNGAAFQRPNPLSLVDIQKARLRSPPMKNADFIFLKVTLMPSLTVPIIEDRLKPVYIQKFNLTAVY